jgi:hypothetical protein
MLLMMGVFFRVCSGCVKVVVTLQDEVEAIKTLVPRRINDIFIFHLMKTLEEITRERRGAQYILHTLLNVKVGCYRLP